MKWWKKTKLAAKSHSHFVPPATARCRFSLRIDSICHSQITSTLLPSHRDSMWTFVIDDEMTPASVTLSPGHQKCDSCSFNEIVPVTALIEMWAKTKNNTSESRWPGCLWCDSWMQNARTSSPGPEWPMQPLLLLPLPLWIEEANASSQRHWRQEAIFLLIEDDFSPFLASLIAFFAQVTRKPRDSYVKAVTREVKAPSACLWTDNMCLGRLSFIQSCRVCVCVSECVWMCVHTGHWPPL